MTTLIACVIALALVQIGVIVHLYQRTKSRPLTYLVKGQVTHVGIERTDGRTIGRVEFQDMGSFLSDRKIR